MNSGPTGSGCARRNRVAAGMFLRHGAQGSGMSSLRLRAESCRMRTYTPEPGRLTIPPSVLLRADQVIDISE